jgi:hypothetical protein
MGRLSKATAESNALVWSGAESARSLLIVTTELFLPAAIPLSAELEPSATSFEPVCGGAGSSLDLESTAHFTGPALT